MLFPRYFSLDIFILWNFSIHLLSFPNLFFTENVHLRVLESSPVGTAIGSVKTTDADIGKNAEVEFRIIDGDGTDMFDIITEKDTQEGIITVKKVPSLHLISTWMFNEYNYCCVYSLMHPPFRWITIIFTCNLCDGKVKRTWN